jgi:NAD(P)-dependent dehydrogenase (short-subunit alcohol dehydrogenase family)
MDKKGLFVITGCSSGIGRALAVAAADAGYRVAATARNPESLAGLKGKFAYAAALDVADGESVSAFAALLREKGERVSVLVNNAGYGAMGPLAEMPRAELSKQFETNVVGALDLVRALFPLMARGSVIVNIGSVSGDFPTPWAGAYCATKAALSAVSEALGLELSPFGIKVVTVKAGGVSSEFGNNAKKAMDRVLAPGSAFGAFAQGMAARAVEGQTRTASAESAAAFILKLAERKNPPSSARFGPKSRSLVLLKALLPKALVDGMMARKFGLGGGAAGGR